MKALCSNCNKVKTSMELCHLCQKEIDRKSPFVTRNQVAGAPGRKHAR